MPPDHSRYSLKNDRKMKKLIVLLLCSAFLCSCNKEEEPLQEFNIKVGDQFTIELEANWSTGYSWDWENSLLVSVVDTSGRIYIQSDPGSGTPGIEKWTFVGKLVGEETLRFIYRKANGEDQEPSDIREFLVNVVSS
jgi:predicted secreted protein